MNDEKSRPAAPARRRWRGFAIGAVAVALIGGGYATASAGTDDKPKNHTAVSLPVPRGTGVTAVVNAANTFLATLSDEQKSEVLLDFTQANATAWSNLPCGGSCRPGIQFGTLSDTQLAAAKAVLKAAQGTGGGTGFDQAMQILQADDVLAAAQGSDTGGGAPPATGPSTTATTSADTSGTATTSPDPTGTATTSADPTGAGTTSVDPSTTATTTADASGTGAATADLSGTSTADPSTTASADPSTTASADPSTTASADPSTTASGEPSATASGVPTDLPSGTPPSGGDGGPGGFGYGSGIYFLAFLGTPSTTGTWQLHFGGHHLAVNLTYRAGRVAGSSPYFVGVEPTSFTDADGDTLQPLSIMRDGMLRLTGSLTTAQQAKAKLTESFSDVLIGPGKDGQFPTTKEGISVRELSPSQKKLVLAAIHPWVAVVDDATAGQLMKAYERELDRTFVSYSGGLGLDTHGDYVRIDGPGVWIEFICQDGVVFHDQIHFHTVYRDHTRDYGGEFTF
ncbi:DUF3500 domain-containing protein [Actinoplanes sp. KI2]|uniref:DUF3500 domain-containing protein n=1 Tax=Actinoplanes sp. KI2 TaxID=2983315 RepID=UPI0021D5CBF4|nr:DUF3500 domain-containing protein [Actinoplanes sp. KI2]MCU7729277.1 DUF3500 domain-containing protein [Actinoplanes sp. KI2]